MTAEKVREMFNEAIAKTTDADKIANLELCREYFTNPEFRQHLSQLVWDINNR